MVISRMDISARSASFAPVGFFDHGNGVWAFECKAAHFVGEVFDLHLRADDVFLQGGDGALALGCVGEHEQFFGSA